MANIWELPTSICVKGTTYPIRTDYRAVIDVLTAFSDKETQGDTKEETDYIRACIMLEIMVPDYASIPNEDIPDVLKALVDFIDMGIGSDNKKQPRLMDWEQDAHLIIPAVNRVMGREIRAMEYCHWWTFLSSYMEIGECSFTHILGIRQKKAKGKKLEKWEQEYIKTNPDVLLKSKLTDSEQREREEEQKAINKFFG